MYRLAIAFFALAFVTISAVSKASSWPAFQGRCAITEANAPSVRGLRLGMSAEQVLGLFPGSSKRREIKDAVDKAKAGTSSDATYLSFNPATDGASQQFAGVESAMVGVHKGRVVDLGIQYGDATWRNIDEWIAKVSEALKLPGAQDWTPGPSENPNKVLRCDGVIIEAAVQGGGSSIRIRNTAYFREIDDRTRAAEEKKRQDAKP